MLMISKGTNRTRHPNVGQRLRIEWSVDDFPDEEDLAVACGIAC